MRKRRQIVTNKILNAKQVSWYLFAWCHFLPCYKLTLNLYSFWVILLSAFYLPQWALNIAKAWRKNWCLAFYSPCLLVLHVWVLKWPIPKMALDIVDVWIATNGACIYRHFECENSLWTTLLMVRQFFLFVFCFVLFSRAFNFKLYFH